MFPERTGSEPILLTGHAVGEPPVQRILPADQPGSDKTYGTEQQGYPQRNRENCDYPNHDRHDLA